MPRCAAEICLPSCDTGGDDTIVVYLFGGEVLRSV